jgi:hypothetical protein
MKSNMRKVYPDLQAQLHPVVQTKSTSGPFGFVHSVSQLVFFVGEHAVRIFPAGQVMPVLQGEHPLFWFA